MLVFSVIGVTLFRDVVPKYFGNLSSCILWSFPLSWSAQSPKSSRLCYYNSINSPERCITESRKTSYGNIHVLSFHAYNPSSRLQAHLFLWRNFFRFSAPLLQYKALPPPPPSGKRSICMQLCTCCFVIPRLQLMLQQCWISSWSKLKCAFISLSFIIIIVHIIHPPPAPLWRMPAQNP